MKTIIRLLSIIILLVFSFSCISKKALVEPKTVILPLGDTVHLTDGSLVYGLPLTIFDVQVEVERRIEKPGPYAKFAGDLLGIKDVINQERETWTISGVKIQSSEELDPSEFYVIESNTLFQSNVFALKKEGLILDLNPDIYEKTKEYKSGKTSPDNRSGFMDLGADEYFVVQSDTIYKLVNVDTAFIKIPYLVEKKKQLTTDQLAEKAAKALLELRDGKHQILSGEATVYPQNSAAIDEMDKLENEYLALFAGKSWTEVKKFSYTLVPHKEMSGKPTTLFRFSNQAGPSDLTTKTGTPVEVVLIPASKVKDLTIITKPQTGNLTMPKFDKLYYRIPDVVTVNLKMGEENLYNSRKLIYQFGEVIQLPANFIIGK
jgi:Domain of unknown function (DUF4831)